jgi:hypothetical protein
MVEWGSVGSLHQTPAERRDEAMTSQIKHICERLKKLGFARENRVKLYGQEFVLTSDPIVLDHEVIFVDAIEGKSQEQRRVRIPLSIVKLATEKAA